MKEERLSRVKRAGGFIHSILDLKSKFPNLIIDLLVYHKIQNDYEDPSFLEDESETILYCKKFFYIKEVCNFSNLTHHISHAALAFYNSGFSESLVFVSDRTGSHFYVDGKVIAREGISVYYFKNNNCEVYYKSFVEDRNIKDFSNLFPIIKDCFKGVEVDLRNSLGMIYSTACGLIGESMSEAGKAMGLSSYADVDVFSFWRDRNLLVDLSDRSMRYFDIKTQRDYPLHFQRTEKVSKDNFKYFANYCKYVQNYTENDALRIIKKYIKKIKTNNICISGGYGNNIVTNAFLKKNLPEQNFYFEPNCDDGGITIGAAYLKHIEKKCSTTITPIQNNFYISYEREKIKDNRAIDYSIKELLINFLNQKTIAIFDGMPEAGQRALGHRSIIFDARNPNGKDLVNKVKMREWYRPFAGVIRKEDFKDYFYDNGFDESPNMMINFDAKEHTCKEFPSIIHVDSTCRIQTVTGGFFYDFITLLKEKTGCPIILNTSFNLAGEPLVHSVEDAIKTFDNSKIDVLYFVEEKKALLK